MPPEQWKSYALGDLLTLAYGKALPERRRSGQGFPVVGSAGIVGFHDEWIADAPAIVVGRKGTAGAVTLVEDPCWPIDTTYYVKLKDSAKVHQRFVSLLLEQIGLRDIATATGVPGLNRDRVYELTAVVPEMSEQRRIVDLFSVMDGVATTLNLQRAKLGQMRAATLAEVFLGEHRIPASYDRFLTNHNP